MYENRKKCDGLGLYFYPLAGGKHKYIKSFVLHLLASIVASNACLASASAHSALRRRSSVDANFSLSCVGISARCGVRSDVGSSANGCVVRWHRRILELKWVQ